MIIYEWVLGWFPAGTGPTSFTRIGEVTRTRFERPVASTLHNKPVASTKFTRPVAKSTNNRSH